MKYLRQYGIYEKPLRILGRPKGLATANCILPVVSHAVNTVE